jgi:hypothetical protein
MKYAVELTSGGMIYISSLMVIGIGFQKTLEEDTHRDTAK